MKTRINYTIQAMNLTELAALYGIHRDTMRKWINPFKEEIGIREGKLFNIRQVKIIFERLGWPNAILEDED